MTSRERVLKTLNGEDPDRIPLNFYAGWNLGIKSRMIDRYGSIDNCLERYRIDIVTGVVPRFPFGDFRDSDNLPELGDYLKMKMDDPLSPAILKKSWPGDMFFSIDNALTYHAHEYGEKAVIAHIWGVLELSQFLFERRGKPGMEDALINMALEPDKTAELYMKLAEWSSGCIENAARAGADIIQISDDWGQENTMLIDPGVWKEMIYPATGILVDTARKFGLPVILHSDGDISQVLDGVESLGVSGLHPVQESAGMLPGNTRERLGRNICIMGGLDVVSAIPVMNKEEICEEVKRVFRAYRDSGPFIFSGSHMFQDDTDLDVLEAAYDEAFRLA